MAKSLYQKMPKAEMGTWAKNVTNNPKHIASISGGDLTLFFYLFV